MKFHKLYEKAIHNILEKILIPPSNLNIARRNMPQITAQNLENYMEWLKTEGVDVILTSMNGAELKPTQLDIDNNKVRSLIINQPPKLNKPLIVSKDNYIMDGHHRFIAKLNMTSNKELVPVKAYLVGLSLKDLLKKTMLYPKVFYRDVDGNAYKTPERGIWI